MVSSLSRAARRRGPHAGAVGSAATVGHYPVTTMPIVVNRPLAEHVSPVKGAASVGIAGYDDAECEGLARDNNTAVSSGDQAVATGNNEAAASSYALANTIYQQMSANCMVIDLIHCRRPERAVKSPVSQAGLSR